MVLIIKDDGRTEPIGTLAQGIKGIDQTTAAMRGLVKKFSTYEVVRRLAKNLGNPENVFHWAAAHIRYEADPKGIELIRVPTMLLRQANGPSKTAWGDCDDNTTLCCSLLAAMNMMPAIIVLGKTPRPEGGKFIHVLPGFIDSNIQAGERSIKNGETMQRRGKHGTGWMVKTDAGWASMFDAQEHRPIGHMPPEPMRKVYVATGEHAA